MWTENNKIKNWKLGCI